MASDMCEVVGLPWAVAGMLTKKGNDQQSPPGLATHAMLLPLILHGQK